MDDKTESDIKALETKLEKLQLDKANKKKKLKLKAQIQELENEKKPLHKLYNVMNKLIDEF